MRQAPLLAAVLAAGAVGTMCAPSPTPTSRAEVPPDNEVWLDPAEVARFGIAIEVAAEHVVSDSLVTPGRVTFDENHVTHVFTPVSGQVRDIYGVLGARVPKGFTLAVIASPDLGQATADFDKAHASLVAAQHQYDRQKGMWPSRATTLGDLEQAEDDLRSARAEEERAEEKASLLHAGPTVSQAFELRSPIAGEVLARSVNPGLEVQGIYDGGSSPELFTVGDLDLVWVLSAVHEQDFARVHDGAPAQLSVVSIDRPFDGFVDWISGSLDPQTRTATLRCVIENRAETLKPEMYGAVTVTATPVRALSIPRQALFPMGGVTLVFFDRGPAPGGRERFERLPVHADEDSPGYYVPVTHGVSAGDKVVTRGMAQIAAKM